MSTAKAILLGRDFKNQICATGVARFMWPILSLLTFDFVTSTPHFSQIIPLNSEETQFEIVIQVANFYHHKGGIDMPLLLGKSNHFSEVKFKRVASDMTFIGSLTLIGLFFLLFFLLYWNKDRAVLYFAILCLSLSYMALSDRYAPFAKLFPTASWTLLTTIEYIALFLARRSRA